MANTINIFGSIDLQGVLDEFLESTIKPFYGFDPSAQILTPEHQNRLLAINMTDYNQGSPHSICRIGYWYSQMDTIPKYVRLMSGKTSTKGWEIKPGETVEHGGKTYLTTAYNLAIGAKKGDTIRWWGHTVDPNSSNQAIISNVVNHHSSTVPTEFTHYHRSNVSFYNAAQAMDPNNLVEGLIIATRQSFSLNCVLNSDPKTISYDIELLLLTAPFMHDGNLIGVPYAKLVVDPTIIVEA